jgi:hypothetical protein
MIQAGGELLRSKIHKPINSIWTKEGFDVTDQLLITFLHSSDTGENGSTMRHQLFWTPMIRSGVKCFTIF